ncbi:MAG: TIGR04372 family glycosyltransferase [Desulfobacterales bacterium]|nr:TIGR04372 family glycosyltransferase [Desulfobacterales bacterium]
MKWDWYLSEKFDGINNGRYLDLFYATHSTNHVNRQWLKMWKRTLPLVPGSKLWQNVVRLNGVFPGYQKHEIPETHVYPDLEKWQAHFSDPFSRGMDIYNKRLNSVLHNKSANIVFTLEEKKKGQKVLWDIGIPKEKQYICFHARDSAYLDTVYPQRDWNYHNYRDSSIQNYVLAAEEMVKRGYYAVRMGAIVKDPIHSSNSKVIDYATNGQRTDFNDIYLGSHCRFFLCSDGGMSAIPEMFRIPVVYVNWTAILRISTWVLNGLFIFKKFYQKKENRHMTFSEIMNFEFDGIDSNEIFARLNLELIENTPEEIRAVTVEMDERLNGTWQTTPEDEELQEQFWALYGPDKVKSPDLRIGAEYLRENQDLLC